MEKNAPRARRALRLDHEAVVTGHEGGGDLDHGERASGALLGRRKPRSVDGQDAMPVYEEQGLRGRGHAGDREVAAGVEADRFRLVDVESEPDPARAARHEAGTVAHRASPGEQCRPRDDHEGEQKEDRRDRAREQAVVFFSHERRRVTFGRGVAFANRRPRDCSQTGKSDSTCPAQSAKSLS